MRPLPLGVERELRLGAFLQAHPHSYTRHELLAAWPRSELDRTVRSALAVRLLPGVYCAASHVREPVVLGEAIGLWAPQCLVTGALALALYAPSLPVPSVVDVVGSGHVHLRPHARVRLHQTGPLRTSSAPRGVPCTVPERAVLDAWRFAASADRANLVYEALWARVCTWRQLRRELDASARVAERRRLERLLAWFERGATSPLEVRARRDVLCGPAFRELEWQARVQAGPRSVVADAAHRRAKVLVELDGAAYHGTSAASAADRDRDIDLAAAGYVTIRFTWDDVIRRPRWCRQRLLAIITTRVERAGSA